MNGNFDQFINNCDNLDEELSVTDFIKTLKKVESSETVNGRDSTSSSSSVEKLAGKTSDEHRKIDKKASANDLLQTMRKRFVHRATEPIFHALPEAQEREQFSGKSSTKSENIQGRRDTYDVVNLPKFDGTLDRKTDSEPTLSKTANKYHVSD